MESELVTYLLEKPRVKSCSDYMQEKYISCKNKSLLINYFMNKTEQYAKVTIDTLVVPIATKSIDISAKIMQPIIGNIEDPSKSLDHYATEKLKSAEKNIDQVVVNSKQKIHNARLKAEDFFIGKCIHAACSTTTNALCSFENSLEKMSFIRKRHTKTTSNDQTNYRKTSLGVSQADCYKTEMEILQNKHFEARQNLLNMFANPQLWEECSQECRELSERINHLHRRIIEDGFLSDIPSNISTYISLYSNSVKSIFNSIMTILITSSQKTIDLSKEKLFYFNHYFKILSINFLEHITILYHRFGYLLHNIGSEISHETTTVYNKIDFFTKLYLYLSITECTKFIVNDILPKTEQNAKYIIPIIASYYIPILRQLSLLPIFNQIIHNTTNKNIQPSSLKISKTPSLSSSLCEEISLDEITNSNNDELLINHISDID